MEFLTSRENQKVINKLQKGIGKTYDLFIYGDKKSGTKPGNISVYGKIKGMQAVLSERQLLQQQLLSQENERGLE